MKKAILYTLLAGAVLVAGYTGFHALFPASTLLTNGRIYTGDPDAPWAEAVFIEGSKVTQVGSSDALMPLSGWRTEVVDLDGKMAMPGIHDAHIHLLLGALAKKVNCELPPSATPDVIIAELKACQEAGRMTDGWLIGGNYDPTVFPDSTPSNDFLNEHFPDTPVYLDDYSLHAALANDKALEMLGITNEVEDPAAGYFGRDQQTGELTGLLSEAAKMQVFAQLPQPSALKTVGAASEVFQELNGFGITSVQDALSIEQMVQLYSYMDMLGYITLDIDTHWPLEFRDVPFSVEDQQRWFEGRAAYASDNIHVDNVKYVLDGVPLPPEPTHAEIDPETGEPDPSHLTISEADLTASLRALDAQGVKVKMHAAGAGASRIALNAIASLAASPGKNGILHDIGHGQSLDGDDRARPANSGAVVEFSPAFWAADETPNGEIFWFRSALEDGLLVTAGSDWPVVESFNPFPAIAGMIDNGEESMSIEQALAIWTINGAISVGRADVQGTISTGKWANIIVLDRDLFRSTPEQIAGTRVLATYFKGARVHEQSE